MGSLFVDGLGSLARQWVLRSGWWRVALALGLAVFQMIFGGMAALMFGRKSVANVPDPSTLSVAEFANQGPLAHQPLTIGIVMYLAVFITGGLLVMVLGLTFWMRSFAVRRRALHRVHLMLELRGVTKRYSGITAVQNVSFVARAGEVTGYLGPNGSGKSTTLKMITGLIEPTEGEILFRGQPVDRDPMAYRQLIGYVPEEPHLYPHLTGAEYLEMVGHLRGLPERPLAEKIDGFLRLLSLHQDRYVPISSYSKGMRQKVLLIAALLHNPATGAARRAVLRARRQLRAGAPRPHPRNSRRGAKWCSSARMRWKSWRKSVPAW